MVLELEPSIDLAYWFSKKEKRKKDLANFLAKVMNCNEIVEAFTLEQFP